MPLFTSEKYNCEVGRIRLDCALDNGCVSGCAATSCQAGRSRGAKSREEY